MREGALLRLADLRRRQGRFDEARRLLEGSESHPSARQTLAAIAYAEDQYELAEDLAQLCLADEAELGTCYDCVAPGGGSCQYLMESVLGVSCVW